MYPFPNEIFEHILLFLPFESLLPMKYVCHVFNDLIDTKMISKVIIKDKLSAGLLPKIVKNIDLMEQIYPLLDVEREFLPRLCGCAGSKEGLNWCISKGLFISQADIYQIIMAGHQDLVLDLLPEKSFLRYIMDYDKPDYPNSKFPRLGRKYFVYLVEDYGGSKCIGKIIRDYQSLMEINPYPEIILVYMIENQLFDQMREQIINGKIYRSYIDNIISIYRDNIKTLFPLIEMFFKEMVKHNHSRSEIENDPYFYDISFETLVWYADFQKIPYSEITIKIPSFLSIGELERAQQMGFKLEPHKSGGYFQILHNLDKLSWFEDHGFELISPMQIEDVIIGAMLYGYIEILECYHHRIPSFQEIASWELGKNQHATNWYLENYGFPNNYDMISKTINVMDSQYLNKLDEITIMTTIQRNLFTPKPKLIFDKFKQLVRYYLKTYGEIQLDLTTIPDENIYFIENKYITNYDYYHWLKHIMN